MESNKKNQESSKSNPTGKILQKTNGAYRLDDGLWYENPNTYWGGVCPKCGKSGGSTYYIGRDHWSACKACKVRWFTGSNLFSGWRYMTDNDYKEHYELLKDFDDAEIIYMNSPLNDKNSTSQADNTELFASYAAEIEKINKRKQARLQAIEGSGRCKTAKFVCSICGSNTLACECHVYAVRAIIVDENNRIGRSVPVAVPVCQLDGNKRYICGDCGEPLGDLDSDISTDEALIEYLNTTPTPEERQAAKERQLEKYKKDLAIEVDLGFLDSLD